MATLYWRGAISSNVQTAGNWTLQRPGLTASVPPSAPNTPQAGDSVIFANFVGGGWNPTYSPAGLIGSGITHTVLNSFTVEKDFIRDIGTQNQYLSAYVTNSFSLKKGINTIPNLPDSQPTQDGKVFIKSLNPSVNLNISAQSNLAVTNLTTNYYIFGSLNLLKFDGVFGANRMKVFLGSSATYPVVLTDKYVGISGGIVTQSTSGSSSTGEWTISIGRFANIGGPNILLGNVNGGSNTVTFERGVSLENIHIEPSSYAAGTYYFVEFNNYGTTYGETGPLGPKTYIKNFRLQGLPYYSGTLQTPLKCDIYSGVSFENLIIDGVTDVDIRYDPSNEVVFAKNMDFYTTSQRLPNQEQLYWPKLTVFDTLRFAVGDTGEQGGANIVFPVGFSYDVPPSIFLNGQGTYILDIV